MNTFRKILVLSVIVLPLFISALSAAENQNKEKRSFITVAGGAYLFEGNQDLEDAPTLGLGIGHNWSPRWGAEAFFNYINSESENNNNDVDGYLYRLDALYYLKHYAKATPYLALGTGAIDIDPEKGEDDWDFMVNYGPGLKYFINENMAVRADLRHVIPFNETHNNLLCTLGLTYYFGRPKSAAAPPADTDDDGIIDRLDQCANTPVGVSVDSNGCPLDNDNDGIYDYLDKCPDTPAGTRVDSLGCPEDIDSDGDGITDSRDKCPETPADVDVDPEGCPKDDDGDGVSDYKDQCPNTPVGADVDERGCWLLKEVSFESGSWEMTPESAPALDKIVSVFKQNPDLKLEIQGHTDNRGEPEYNQQLSENRAKAVMIYLIEKGIDPNRLKAVGYGISKPIFSNETAEGRSRNRRVELVPYK